MPYNPHVDGPEVSTLGACRQCAQPVPPRSRHVKIVGATIYAYCSSECLEQSSSPVELFRDPRPRRRWPRALLHVGLGLAAAAHLSGAPEPQVAATAAVADAPKQPEPPLLGPAWPPSEEELASLLAGDTWIHPLDGPIRHMPISHGRVFGAERPGERPPECRSGHCGVDIGDSWGDRVHVVHDGVIDRVVRGPNEDHGGLYVRVAHRGGTIFTQYFHLGGIPKWITPGRFVRAGTVIGVLGDTGIKESRPHLHFTISVKPAKNAPERFIDPEPLIALWPLRVPVAGQVGIVQTEAAPGVPRGASFGRAKKPRRPAVTAAAMDRPELVPAP